MMLTPTQLATLLAAVQADPTANGYRVAGDAYSLLRWCNAAKSPAQLAWRVSVPPQDADDAPDYSTFDTIVAGKRESWGFFLNYPRDFSRGKVRKWITDVWGAATAGSSAEAILLAGTENATNAQIALGGTTRTTGTVTALDRSFSGSVGDDDVNKMIAS